MPDEEMAAIAAACPQCGTQVAPRLLTCAGCHRLVHADRLKQLADQAKQAEAGGAWSDALVAWRAALELLPRATKQAQAIEARIAELGTRVDAAPVSRAPRQANGSSAGAEGAARKPWTSLAGIGTLLLVVASKTKFLLLGLTKGSTFLTMFASLGVYWTAFGWKLALGLVLSIYIHEMGHVAALLRYGVKASAPLFLPGLGAVIRLTQNLGDPRQDARVGLAGPVWGLGAALACYVAYLVSDVEVFAAIAKLGAWLNLLNLMPIWQLDGGRAFRAFSRPQRWMAAAAIAVAWSLTSNVLLLVLLVVAVLRTVGDRRSNRPDAWSLVVYVVLIGVLSAMTLIPVGTQL